MAEAVPIKPFGSIGAERYWFFKPLDKPFEVYVRDPLGKIHKVREDVLPLIQLSKDQLRSTSVKSSDYPLSFEWSREWIIPKLNSFKPEWPVSVTQVIPIKGPTQFDKDVIKEYTSRISDFNVDQVSEDVRRLQTRLSGMGYKVSVSGKFDEPTQVALGTVSKLWNLEKEPFPTVKNFPYYLLREQNSDKVYFIDPVSKEAKWVKAEAVPRLPFFDWNKVFVVPSGYVSSRYKAGSDLTGRETYWGTVVDKPDTGTIQRAIKESIEKEVTITPPKVHEGPVTIKDVIAAKDTLGTTIAKPIVDWGIKNLAKPIGVIKTLITGVPKSVDTWKQIKEQTVLPLLSNEEMKAISTKTDEWWAKNIPTRGNDPNFASAMIEKITRDIDSDYADLQKTGFMDKDGNIILEEPIKNIISEWDEYSKNAEGIDKELADYANRINSSMAKAKEAGDKATEIFDKASDIKLKLDREQGKDIPDEGIVNDLINQGNLLTEEYNKWQSEFGKYQKETIDLNTQFEAKRAEYESKYVILKTGQIPQSWLDAQVVFNTLVNKLDKIKTLEIERNEWIDKLYRLGEIDSKTAAAQKGLSVDEFMKSLSPVLKERREKTIQTKIYDIEAEVHDRMKSFTSPLNLSKEIGSTAFKGVWDLVNTTFDLIFFDRKILASLLGAMRDMTDFFSFMPGGKYQKWPTTEEINKMKLEDLQKLTTAATMVALNGPTFNDKVQGETALEMFSDFLYKTGKDYVLTEKGWDIIDSAATEIEKWPGAKQIIGKSQVADLILKLALFGFITGGGNERILKLTESFKKIDKKFLTYFDDLDRAIRTAAKEKNVPLLKDLKQSRKTILERINYELIGKGQKEKISLPIAKTFSSMVGNTLRKVLGEPYRKIFPRYLPTLDSALLTLFEKTLPKYFPEKLKYEMFAKRKEIQEKVGPMEENLISAVNDLLVGSTKDEAFAKLIKIMKDPSIPVDANVFDLLVKLDPKMYKGYQTLIDAGPKGAKILAAIKEPWEKKLTDTMKLVAERIAYVEKIPHKWQKELVSELLISQRAGGAELRKKLVAGILQKYGQKNLDKLYEWEKQGRELYNASFLIDKAGQKRAGFVKLKNVEFKKRASKESTDISKMLDESWAHHASWKTAHEQGLLEGLLSDVSRRERKLMLKDLNKLADDSGFSRELINKFANNLVNQDLFPSINSYRLKILEAKNFNEARALLTQGNIRAFQKFEYNKFIEALEASLKTGEFLTPKQAKVVQDLLKQLKGTMPVSFEFIRDFRKAFGLVPDPVTGLSKLRKYEMYINGKYSNLFPITLRNIASGAWKESHPDLAEAWFVLKEILGIPISAWKTMVLFARPGWYFRNILDDNFRMMVASGEFKLKDIQTLFRTFTKKGRIKLAEEAMGFSPEAMGLGSTGFFASNVKGYSTSPIRKYWLALADKSAFADMADDAWRFKDKLKVGLQKVATDSETARKYAMFNISMHKGATMAAEKELLEFSRQGTKFKNFLNGLAGGLISKTEKIRLQELAIRASNFTLTGKELKEITKILTRLKLKDPAIIERAFKKVEEVLFDYSDLRTIERGIRSFVPFYGFFSKNFELWTKAVAKNPRLIGAARVYLKAMEDYSATLPDTYKGRIQLWGNWYVLPLFSFQDILDIWKDPVGEMQKWYKNPNRPIPGLGWNPYVSGFIQKLTGKNYWNDEKELSDYGWTDEMTKMIGKDQVDMEEKSLSKDIGSMFRIYAEQVPIYSLWLSLKKLSDDSLGKFSEVKRSSVIGQMFTYFTGANIRNISDVARLWSIHNSLGYNERKEWISRLEKESPGLYDDLRKLTYINQLTKIVEAKEQGLNDPIFEAWMKSWFLQEQYYYIYNTQGKDKANYFLATNPDAKQAMEIREAIQQSSPANAATRTLSQINQVINFTNQMDSKLSATYDDANSLAFKKAQYSYILGKDYPSDFTKDDLNKMVFDENGKLKVHSIAELEALLATEIKSKDWLRSLVEKTKDDITSFSGQYYRDVIDKNQKEKDLEYSVAMQKFGSMWIPNDVAATIEQRSAAKKRALDYFFGLPEDIQAMYVERHPDKYKIYEFEREYINIIARMIDPSQLAKWYDNFYNDKILPPRYREYFFLKNPLAKIYYPSAMEFYKLAAEDEANQKATGLFYNTAQQYLDKLNPSIKKAWQEAKPDFWETQKYYGMRNLFIQQGKYKEASDWTWAPQWEAVRERHFATHPEDRQMWKIQSEYWKMPRDTWVDRHEANLFLLQNPDYIKWMHRFDVTEEQKQHSIIKDQLRESEGKLKPNGFGDDFIIEQVGIDKQKNKLYADNPWLEEESVSYLTGDSKIRYELNKQFMEIPQNDFEAKAAFLEKHPELKEAWRNNTAPWEQKILELQDQYFKITDYTQRSVFIKEHPELAVYWDAKSLPWSYWYDKPVFEKAKKTVDTVVNSIEDNNWSSLPEALREIVSNPKTDEDTYIINQVYKKIIDRWIKLGQEDSGTGWSYFNNLPKVLQDVYYKKNPDAKGYFEFTTIWREKLALTDSNEAAVWFNSPINSKYKKMYYTKHPGSEVYLKQMEEVAKMPSETYEDSKKIRLWWEQHPELRAWINKKESPIDATIRRYREAYFAILDRIPVKYTSNYWQEYFTVKNEAKDYLAKHPELSKWFENNKSVETELSKIQDQYFIISSPEARRKFLVDHPELKDYWMNKSPEPVRKIMDLQNQYFAIPKYEFKKRTAFLESHPDLQAYWDYSDTPSIINKDKYDKIINQFNLYFKQLVTSSKAGEDYFRTLPYEIRNQYFDGSFDNYVLNNLYSSAMQTWIKVINENFLRGTYYFKHLPAWMRKRYLISHPEKQFTFQIPLEDFIMEPLRQWEEDNPQLAWAYRIMYKYGQLGAVPEELRKKVEQIFINAKIWEDRSKWTADEWKNYWYRQNLLNHELKEIDLLREPRLKEMMQRAAIQFQLKPKPKPLFRRAPRKGWIVPFY